ncbi:MAG: DNA polymerase III subunit gamma/tau [Tannerella sp.]|jgi:DNA polymerase-3 subunit gamma/tau|nr:DNA polymerase III subunit gamma/tau [Tannerella sp.]
MDNNYIVSARKYRPATFDSVVGQKSLTTTLKNAIQRNRLAHAYLFCGPRGVGKTSCARIFAKTINCMNPGANGEACNECESCRSFNEQRSLNIHELDAASNNSVDDIRALTEQVRIPPQLGEYKVYIIDEVHMLTSQAFNAFLKTLEEPPRHAIFILATTEKQKIIPTILSRCQIYDFSRIGAADIVEQLQRIASREGIVTEAEALNIIARKADGGMRDALSIFDQIASYTEGHITYQAVIENLNVLDYDYYFRFTDSLLKGEVRNSLLILNEILEKGFDGQHIITGLASHFRDLLVCRDESTLVLFEMGASIRDRYRNMSKQCSEQMLFHAIALANDCDLKYNGSRNKRLLLELTLIQLCQLTASGAAAPPEEKKKQLQPVADAPATSSTLPPSVQTAAITVTPESKKEPEPATPPAAVNRRPPSTSINRMLNEPQAAFGTVETGSSSGETSFDAEELARRWDEYAGKIPQNKGHLKNTMMNCKPVLKSDFLFEVVVHNPVQKDELVNESAAILQALRTQLGNRRIQLKVVIDEANTKKLAYTPAEKYEYLHGINTLLSELKDEFDLTVQ